MRTPSDLVHEARQLNASGKPLDAQAVVEKALLREPYHVDGLLLLGHIFRERGDWAAALAQFQKAAAIAPGNAGAHYGMAAAHHALNQLEAAAQACQRVIQLRPDFANAWTNLGTALSQMGMQAEAVELFRRAVALDPHNPYTHSNLLYALHFLPQVSAEEIRAEHQRWDEQHARGLAHELPPPANDRSPDRRLRIGYVSPDFREHSVAFFFEPLLQSHHRRDFHINCYGASDREDATTARLRSLADQWCDISHLSDQQAAERIRADGIDILIDLSGHTSQHRLLVFARKPAPVQMSYLGYPGDTGLSAIGCRMSDGFADPVESERVMRLSTEAWCYQAPGDVPEIQARREGPITFASFNRIAKVTPELISLWSQILTAVPMSELLLKSEGLHEPVARDRMVALFAQHHIAANRIRIEGRVPTIAKHLELYNDVDISLDTYPYHGTTTTCESLYMGVPVVTLAGQTHAARVGVSLLTSAGLPELLAQTPDEYFRIATSLANDPARLGGLRAGLREQMLKSPLMDGERLATEIESAYRTAWRAWCAGV
jgi:predicted O-linked N-acetylglucosamine transferase (SPINDLY family)